VLIAEAVDFTVWLEVKFTVVLDPSVLFGKVAKLVAEFRVFLILEA